MRNNNNNMLEIFKLNQIFFFFNRFIDLTMK
jgi:hypothetical protein